MSPGVNFNVEITNTINKLGKNILTDIDIFNQKKKNNVICITGTNGKTTVTLLIEHMLNSLGKKAKAGGNIGFPVLDMLEENRMLMTLSSYRMHRIYLAATMNYGLGSDDQEELAYYNKIRKEIEEMKKDSVKKGIPFNWDTPEGMDK